jgi:hypothetical protein
MDEAEIGLDSRTRLSGKMGHRQRIRSNGYVQLSERLDWLFMLIFLTLVTGPVIALFVMM